MYENTTMDGILLKRKKNLYKDYKTNILSTILLLVNLKVLNDTSNTCIMKEILRYAI